MLKNRRFPAALLALFALCTCLLCLPVRAEEAHADTAKETREEDSFDLSSLLDREKLKELSDPENLKAFVKEHRIVLAAVGGGIAAVILISALSGSLYAKRKQREEEIRRQEAEEARLRREEQNRMADALAAKRRRGNANPMPLSKYMLRRSDGAVFPIGPGVNVIGRGDEGVQISFPPDEVLISRKHCALEVMNGTLYLTDLGSVNGTFVAGMKLPPNNRVALRNGSSFWLATTKFTFTVC